MLGALVPLHSSASNHNTNFSNKAILAGQSRVGHKRVCHLFVTGNPPRGAYRRFNCDDCRPDTLGGEFRSADNVRCLNLLRRDRHNHFTRSVKLFKRRFITHFL